MRLSRSERERAEAGIRRTIAGARPRTVGQLQGWLRVALGIEVPAGGRCGGHGSPMEYLAHVFFERPGDVVVWANRGGGKTFYGAVATLLDMVFKPGIEVRILGGSLEQSRMMYHHLRGMLDRPGFAAMAQTVTAERIELRNGSRVELLAQSETSVRGHRVQKLRCDEVELFDRDVWQAAQFVTRSAVCGGVSVRGSVEVMSTMHRPFGLMHELVTNAELGTRNSEVGTRNSELGTRNSERGEGKGEEGAGNSDLGTIAPLPVPHSAFRVPRSEIRDLSSAFRVINWCALDVMGRCPAEIPCEGCKLWDACGGRAKGFRGFLKAEDVIAQRKRSSGRAFDAEMLCRFPSRDFSVFPMFDAAVHVREVEPRRDVAWIGGIDWGLHNPFVMVWAQLVPTAEGTVRVEVVDEYVQRGQITQENLGAVKERGWPEPRWIGADPAGNQRSSQTGQCEIAVARRNGWRIRDRASRIVEGVEIVMRRLENGAGDDGLVIHPRCVNLIRSMSEYHYNPDRPWDENPVKDNTSDHAVDALRYMVVNLEGVGGKVEVKGY